jgi:parvulin-like peptidyl-prolyl isomerase
MKMRTGIIFTTAMAAILCAFQNAPAADTNEITMATPGNPVIARGTGFEITRGDLDEALAGARAQLQTMTSAQQLQVQRQVLTNLINNALLLAKATDADKTDAQKAADLQMTAAIENAGSRELFDQRLKTNNLTEDVLRARLTQDATAQAVLARELKVSVTDAEAKSYYDTHTFDYEQPEMARVSHILIFTVDPVTHVALPGAQLDARRRLCESLVTAARAGADFSQLAKQYSEDPGSKANGGELLPFPRGQMAPEIDNAAFSMTSNQVSDVITTSIGYQIIKLLEKIPSKKTDYLTAIADIKQGLARQKFAQLAPAYLDGLKKAAAVEILDPNLKPVAANGGSTSVTTPAATATP